MSALALDRQSAERWRSTVDFYLASAALHRAVDVLVDGFFAHYPQMERTPRSEAFVSGLALDRISAATRAADSTQQTNAA